MIQFGVLLVLLLSRASISATELYDMNRNARALGMGNAYSAIVDDADALFYNPAGLGRVGRISWTMIDANGGVSGLSAYQKVAEVQSQESSELADTLQELYGENVWLGVHAKSAILLPRFAVAYYNSTDSSVQVHNPPAPELRLNAVADTGLAMGGALPFGPFIDLGVVVRRLNRLGNRRVLTAETLGDLDTDLIKDELITKGSGLALDTGVNISVPAFTSPTLSFVWRDVGRTKFRAEKGEEAPPSQESEMLVGAGLDIDLPLLRVRPAVDFRFLNRSDETALGKKINFGVEVELLMLALRGGFHQGYYTLGAGVNLGLIRVDVATYGAELGTYAGQIEDRRYVASATLEFGIDIFGSGSGSSSSSSSSGSGYRPRRGAKVRR